MDIKEKLFDDFKKIGDTRSTKKRTLKQKVTDGVIQSIMWALTLVLIILAIVVLLFPIVIAWETGNHWALTHLLYSWIPSLGLGIASLIAFIFSIEMLD